jgi:DNA-binding MarR family transcriptional regulator
MPGLSAKQIAEATEMDKVAVSRAVARLVAARRVSANADREDARRQRLTLTSAGALLHAKIAPIALDTESRLLSSLDMHERADLDRLVTRLSAAAKLL